MLRKHCGNKIYESCREQHQASQNSKFIPGSSKISVHQSKLSRLKNENSD